MTFWLKPVGLPDSKISPEEWYGQYVYIHFPVRPSGVKVGDQMLIYAVGHRLLVALVEVISPPWLSTKDEISAIGAWRGDFPWNLACKNLKKNFNLSWHQNKVNPLILAEEYHTRTGQPVTRKGHPNLDALQRQKDKIGLTEGFAQFLIQKMEGV